MWLVNLNLNLIAGSKCPVTYGCWFISVKILFYLASWSFSSSYFQIASLVAKIRTTNASIFVPVDRANNKMATVKVRGIISFCAITKFPEGPFEPAGQFSRLANTRYCTTAKGCRDLIELVFYCATKEVYLFPVHYWRLPISYFEELPDFLLLKSVFRKVL